MSNKPLLILAVVSVSLTLNPAQHLQAKEINTVMNDIMPSAILHQVYPKATNDQLIQIKTMLFNNHLSKAVINKVLSVLRCSANSTHERDDILTVIDYSLPSNEKRLWVFDLANYKLLYNTYVSHGIKSGVLASNHFSNKHDSKESSIGVYKTDKPYYGRHGLSLKLSGLDYGFNDNADSRAVVMHGGWYVDEDFIKRYGRAGRSWGCPAVPSALTKPIIDTIKGDSLFVAYYPSDSWFGKSRFLKCDYVPATQYETGVNQSIDEIEQRDEILFADTHQKDKLSDSTPVIVISANCYERIFHHSAPLTRMLRRQMNHLEYVALNAQELQSIANNMDTTMTPDDTMIYFVVADVKMERGYYVTEMRVVNQGHIMDLKSTSNSPENPSYVINLESKNGIDIKSSKRFLRWIGL